jgi:hypothetical protein
MNEAAIAIAAWLKEHNVPHADVRLVLQFSSMDDLVAAHAALMRDMSRDLQSDKMLFGEPTIAGIDIGFCLRKEGGSWITR